MEYSSLPALPNRMNTRYSPAATRGTSVNASNAPNSAALARLPRSARHQLWHLVTPLLRSLLLLLLVALPGATWAQNITGFAPTGGPIGASVTVTKFDATTSQNVVFFKATQAAVTAAGTTSLTVTVPLGPWAPPTSTPR